jgi:hypothetical protein
MHINTIIAMMTQLWQESGCNFDEFLVLVDEVDPELAALFERNTFNRDFFVELHFKNMQSALRKVT